MHWISPIKRLRHERYTSNYSQENKNFNEKKSGEERLMMGFSMFETAKKLVISSLFSKSNKLSHANLRKAIFLRFYGNDLSPDMKKKVLRFWS